MQHGSRAAPATAPATALQQPQQKGQGAAAVTDAAKHPAKRVTPAAFGRKFGGLKLYTTALVAEPPASQHVINVEFRSRIIPQSDSILAS